MKQKNYFGILLLFLLAMSACSDDDDTPATTPPTEVPEVTESEAVQEARSILAAFTSYGGTAYNMENPAITFPSEANVYIKSVYGVNYELRDATTNPSGPITTLPMYRGLDPDGNEVDYIITEASDREMAEILGVPYTPRIAAAFAAGRQDVTIEDGIITFKGKVDFSGTRSVTPGTENDAPLTTFPPAGVSPGATADDEWSSFVYMPSGAVINAQLVANSTGIHDRIPHGGDIGEDNQDNPYIDRTTRKVTMQLLDGWRGGNRYFYHLVTDASDPGPAAIELGVFAPRLNQLSNFGEFPAGCFLGFSPNSNGPDIMGDNNQADLAQSQGLNVAVQYNQEIDPVNAFPFGPDNIEFSPMWDAHVSQWTQAAVDSGEVRIIKGISDLRALITQGHIMNFVGNPTTGPSNPLIAGLRPTGLLINCPVVSQPLASAIGSEYGQVLKP